MLFSSYGGSSNKTNPGSPGRSRHSALKIALIGWQWISDLLPNHLSSFTWSHFSSPNSPYFFPDFEPLIYLDNQLDVNESLKTKMLANNCFYLTLLHLFIYQKGRNSIDSLKGLRYKVDILEKSCLSLLNGSSYVTSNASCSYQVIESKNTN